MKGSIGKNQQGVSIIAAIFIIVVLGFMGVMFLSMVNTGSLTAVNDLQSAQALNVAEGGIEYGKAFLRPYNNWYAFADDPVNDPVNLPANKPLGVGTFTTTINFPATSLRANLGGGPVNMVVRVRSIGRFPTVFPFYILIDAEYLQCTAANTPPPTLTCNRQALFSTIKNHLAGRPVYPVVDLAANIDDVVTVIPFVGDPGKFLPRGTLMIRDAINGDEEVTYASLQTAPAPAFIGCQRGRNGTTAVAHLQSNGDSNLTAYITPLDSTSEAYLTSTGSVGGPNNAQRSVSDVANQ